MEKLKRLLKKTPPVPLGIAGALLFLLLFYTLAFRTPLWQVWMPPNIDNDEVIYNRQVVSVIAHGGPLGPAQVIFPAFVPLGGHESDPVGIAGQQHIAGGLLRGGGVVVAQLRGGQPLAGGINNLGHRSYKGRSTMASSATAMERSRA